MLNMIRNPILLKLMTSHARCYRYFRKSEEVADWYVAPARRSTSCDYPAPLRDGAMLAIGASAAGAIRRLVMDLIQSS